MATNDTKKRRADDGREKQHMKFTSIAKFTRGDTIKVLVGPEKVEFMVHKDLLIEHSPFFAARYKSCWNQIGTESCVELEDVTVASFELIIDWIYCSKINTFGSESTWNEDISIALMKAVLEGYKIADLLLMNLLQDRLLETLRTCFHKHNRTFTINFLRDLAQEGLCHSPLGRFAIKSIAYDLVKGEATEEEFVENLNQLAKFPEVLKDLILGVARYRDAPPKNPINYVNCEFHVHSKDEQCPLKELSGK